MTVNVLGFLLGLIIVLLLAALGPAILNFLIFLFVLLWILQKSLGH